MSQRDGLKLSSALFLSATFWTLAIWKFPIPLKWAAAAFMMLCVILLIRGVTEREYWHGVGFK